MAPRARAAAGAAAKKHKEVQANGLKEVVR